MGGKGIPEGLGLGLILRHSSEFSPVTRPSLAGSDESYADRIAMFALR